MSRYHQLNFLHITQSFIHRSKSKNRDPERGSSSSSSVAARTFNYILDGVSTRTQFRSLSGRLATWLKIVQLSLDCAGIHLTWRQSHKSTVGASLTCGGCCHCQRPPTSFRELLVQATYRIRKVERSALPPGSHSLLYATIFHVTTNDRIEDKGVQIWQD